MSRETIATIGTTLLPALLLALTALAAYGASLVARHIKDKRYGAAITLLAYGAAGVVADFAQHTVGDLKDPSKAGTWDAVTAASIKLRAVAIVRELYPLAVTFVTTVLRDPSKVDALLGTLVEKAVVDLKAKAPPKLSAVEIVPGVGAEPDDVAAAVRALSR